MPHPILLQALEASKGDYESPLPIAYRQAGFLTGTRSLLQGLKTLESIEELEIVVEEILLELGEPVHF